MNDDRKRPRRWRWWQRLLAGVAALVPLLVAVYLLGPRPGVNGDVAPVTMPVAAELDAWLARREAAVGDIVPGAEKGIRWAGEPGTTTDIALVYIHGFSAARVDCDPVVQRLADALGANAFFTRLAGHARITPDVLADFNARDWLQDAEEAWAIGSSIGRRVVLVGMSTGSTLVHSVAAAHPGEPAAMVLMSPNYGVNDPRAGWVLGPWGTVIARLARGSYHEYGVMNAQQGRYWTERYPVQGVVEVLVLAHHVYCLDHSRVTTPTLVFLNPADPVVNAGRAREVAAAFGGRTEIEPVDRSDTGHPIQRHYVAGDIIAPDGTDATVARTLEFLRDVLGLDG